MEKKHDGLFNGLFEVLYEDKDGVEKQFAVVRGEKVAADVVNEQTKGFWLGGDKRNFHYRPLVITEGDNAEALWLDDEKEVFVSVVFVPNRDPSVVFSDTASWTESVVEENDDVVIVHYSCLISDFCDCKTKADCETKAVTMALNVRTKKDKQNVEKNIADSLKAYVMNELSMLRLGWAMDEITRSLIFRMAGFWKNKGYVSTVDIVTQKGETQWNYAVDTGAVTMPQPASLIKPLSGADLSSAIENVIVSLLYYALDRTREQIGFKLDDTVDNRYDFSFYLANGLCVSVFSSNDDLWFEVDGNRVEISKIHKRWFDIIEGITE